MIVFPYQSSSISLFEYYCLNIPLFAPSLLLLKKWIKMYDITFEKNYGNPSQYMDLILESEREKIAKKFQIQIRMHKNHLIIGLRFLIFITYLISSILRIGKIY